MYDKADAAVADEWGTLAKAIPKLPFEKKLSQLSCGSQ
jgi:hypothetical protein